jgi:hypothetical protein
MACKKMLLATVVVLQLAIAAAVKIDLLKSVVAEVFAPSHNQFANPQTSNSSQPPVFSWEHFRYLLQGGPPTSSLVLAFGGRKPVPLS